MLAISRRFAWALTLGVLVIAAPAHAEAQQFKPGVDADGNGSLNLEEFVMAMAARDYRRFDRNKDDKLTLAEWMSHGGRWQLESAERFNKDGDDIMSADELVEMYSFIFGRRDKDKSANLSVSETPQFLLQK